MRNWKRIVGLTAMFVAVGLLSFAAEAGAGAGEGRRGRGGGAGMAPEEYAKLMKEASTTVAKFAAKEVGLEAAKTDKFVTAYVAEREASTKRMTEARKGGGDREAFTKLMEENRKALQDMLAANMTAEQAKKALDIVGGGGMGGGLEGRVVALLGAKVESEKIAKALPILAKFNKAQSDMFAKMRSNEMSQEDMQAKSKELRESTAKELAPIVGEENATRVLSGFGGMRGGRGGAGGGGQKAP